MNDNSNFGPPRSGLPLGVKPEWPERAGDLSAQTIEAIAQRVVELLTGIRVPHIDDPNPMPRLQSVEEEDADASAWQPPNGKHAA